METKQEIKTEIPYGYCHCGCGQKTSLYKNTEKIKNKLKGTPLKFILGHARKNKKYEKQRYCKRGHERTPENLIGRKCKKCALEQQQKRREPLKHKRVYLKKEFCLNGHKRTPENLKDGGCKICIHERRISAETKLKDKVKVDELKDQYIITQLKRSIKLHYGIDIERYEFSPETIELNRTLIKLKRRIKQCR